MSLAPRGSILTATPRGFTFYLARPAHSIPGLKLAPFPSRSALPWRLDLLSRNSLFFDPWVPDLKLAHCPRSLAPTIFTLPLI
jgi:hypothetical protein